MHRNYEITISNPEIREGAESNEVTVNLHQLAKALTSNDIAEILDTYLNSFTSSTGRGQDVGLALRDTHRSLQRNVVGFALGILMGIADQDYTDRRNEDAINTAKAIREMVFNDELTIGPAI